MKIFMAVYAKCVACKESFVKLNRIKSSIAKEILLEAGNLGSSWKWNP